MTSEQYLKYGKTPHWLPLAVFGTLAAIMTSLALIALHITPLYAAVIIVVGVMSWTFVEYVLHRFSFHNITNKEPWKFLSSGFHLLHHEIPNAPDYVVAPLIMAMPIFLVFLGLIWAVSQSLGFTLLWGTGLSIGYLVYEWIHYSTHHSKPKTRLGKYLKQYHMVHHFKDSHNYYGVSSPFWDIVFRTKPTLDMNQQTEILPIKNRNKMASASMV